MRKEKRTKELLVQNLRFNLSIHKPDPESLHSSPLPLSPSKTTLTLRRWNGVWYGMDWLLNKSRYMPLSRQNKAKTAKRAGKRKAEKKTEESRLQRGVRSCVAGGTAVRHPPRAVVGPVGSPWWGLSTMAHSFSLRCVLCSFGASIGAVGFAYVGSF